MKIAGTHPVRNASLGRRNKTSQTSDGSFANELTGSRSPAGVSPASQAGAIEGILALQEVDEDGRGRKQAVEQGEEMLDRLDEIRSGLLTGSLNRGTLEKLLEQVSRRAEDAPDPRLREILEEIKLRAAVELAKLGQSA
jgi:hypothetical protein